MSGWTIDLNVGPRPVLHKPQLLLVAYVNRKPTTHQEFMASPMVKAQFITVRRSGLLMNDVRGRRIVVVGRRRHFAASPEFTKAVAMARLQGTKILIPSLVQLIARTPEHLQRECIDALLAVEDLVLDLELGPGWNNHLSPGLLAGLRLSQHHKSAAVRIGRRAGKKNSTPPRNAEIATVARQRLADQRAEELRPFVARLEADLQRQPTPAEFARALNAAGQKPPRAAIYSVNSAGRILSRLSARHRM